MSPDRPRIAVIGGTGNLGSALARRWARAGYAVIVGSRDPTKATAVAAGLAGETGGDIEGLANRAAAEAGELIVVAVPFANQAATLEDIQPAVIDKIVVDATVPLVPPKVSRAQLPREGSAALIAQGILGDRVTVVSAFHNVAAHKLATDETVDCDVLVFGDSRPARSAVVRLAEAAGLRGIHGGPLANSAAAEALTSVLIFINRIYQADGAGVRITGSLVPPEDL